MKKLDARQERWTRRLRKLGAVGDLELPGLTTPELNYLFARVREHTKAGTVDGQGYHHVPIELLRALGKAAELDEHTTASAEE